MSLTQSLAFPVLKDAAIFLEIKGSKKIPTPFTLFHNCSMISE